MEAAAVQVHRPGYGSWLLASLLGFIVGVLASLPAALFYSVMVDAYIDNSGGKTLTLGTALVGGILMLISVFAGWLSYAAVVHGRMPEWTNGNVARMAAAIVGLAFALFPISALLTVLLLVIAFLLLPLLLMQLGDRDPGRTPVTVLAVVLALLAVIAPIIALGADIRPL